MLLEILEAVFGFIRNLTFGAIVMLQIKLIVLCFVYVCACEWLDIVKCGINCLLVGVYNYCTTKVQNKVEERTVIPYKRSPISASKLIDISNLIKVTPKLVAKINIMNGRVNTEKVLKSRGIPGRFVYPREQGMTKGMVAIPERKCVQKSFVYTQSLINTLNLHYANWQELNPELWDSLSKEEIVAEEIVIPYLRSFRN